MHGLVLAPVTKSTVENTTRTTRTPLALQKKVCMAIKVKPVRPLLDQTIKSASTYVRPPGQQELHQHFKKSDQSQASRTTVRTDRLDKKERQHFSERSMHDWLCFVPIKRSNCSSALTPLVHSEPSQDVNCIPFSDSNYSCVQQQIRAPNTF